MEDTTWFNEWIDMYLSSIGHTDRSRTVLMAMKHHIVHEVRATAAELGEVASRQVAGARVPQFPAEVTNALVRELRMLREERALEAKPDHSTAYYESPKCSLCNGSGLVIVPHWQCVLQPHSEPPRLCFYPGTRQVSSVAVLCDLPGCVPGREAREREAKSEKKRPSYTAYLRRFGGLDVRAMLLDHEAATLAAIRKRPAPPGSDAVLEVIQRALARSKANEQQRNADAA